ncbi:unnamed protein product [Blepharisma stoltei]|uniref:Uncharacterized protein n=1 Tax=Blepharisma stoltei TaxID=1481888 RepID=A0AAU9K6L3_9CILI|nr:unnamed protein product [Blepharisma stoltei]
MLKTPDEERVKDLAVRLKFLRDELRPIYKGKLFRTNEVPDYIKEEVCRLFDEHGGKGILKRVCNISDTQIKCWYKQWKENPRCYETVESQKLRKKKLKEAPVNINEIGPLEKFNSCKVTSRKTNRKKYKGTEDICEIKNMMTVDIQNKCEEIKSRMDSSGDISAGRGLNYGLKKDIVKLVLKAGHPRPIALLLGLSERVVEGWKDNYETEIIENYQD